MVEGERCGSSWGLQAKYQDFKEILVFSQKYKENG